MSVLDRHLSPFDKTPFVRGDCQLLMVVGLKSFILHFENTLSDNILVHGEHDGACLVCQQPNNYQSLACNECPRAFHIDCLTANGANCDGPTWLCALCRRFDFKLAMMEEGERKKKDEEEGKDEDVAMLKRYQQRLVLAESFGADTRSYKQWFELEHNGSPGADQGIMIAMGAFRMENVVRIAFEKSFDEQGLAVDVGKVLKGHEKVVAKLQQRIAELEMVLGVEG